MWHVLVLCVPGNNVRVHVFLKDGDAEKNFGLLVFVPVFIFRGSPRHSVNPHFEDAARQRATRQRGGSDNMDMMLL